MPVEELIMNIENDIKRLKDEQNKKKLLEKSNLEYSKTYVTLRLSFYTFFYAVLVSFSGILLKIVYSIDTTSKTDLISRALGLSAPILQFEVIPKVPLILIVLIASVFEYLLFLYQINFYIKERKKVSINGLLLPFWFALGSIYALLAFLIIPSIFQLAIIVMGVQETVGNVLLGILMVAIPVFDLIVPVYFIISLIVDAVKKLKSKKRPSLSAIFWFIFWSSVLGFGFSSVNDFLSGSISIFGLLSTIMILPTLNVVSLYFDSIKYDRFPVVFSLFIDCLLNLEREVIEVRVCKSCGNYFFPWKKDADDKSLCNKCKK